MKVRPLDILTTVVVMALSHPLVTPADGQTTSCNEANWPVLQPSAPAYQDAMDLARTLSAKGLIVQCVAPSKMVATFDGLAGAALYKTNRGSFDALFLPSQRTFDRLQIVERKESGRHLYSFAGDPKPWPANLIDASRPLYFVKDLNRLVVAQDKEFALQLRSILTRR